MPMNAKHITLNAESVCQSESRCEGCLGAYPFDVRGEACGKDEHGRRPGGDGAHVLHPLAHRQTSDVCGSGDGQPPERHERHEPLLVDETDPARTARVGQHAGDIHELHGQVKEIVRPVAPAREETVRLAELPASPQIHATLARIAPRVRQNGNRLGNEERDESEHPQRRPSTRPNTATGGMKLRLTMAATLRRTRSLNRSVRGRLECPASIDTGGLSHGRRQEPGRFGASFGSLGRPDAVLKSRCGLAHLDAGAARAGVSWRHASPPSSSPSSSAATLVAGLIVRAQRDDEGPVDLIVFNGRVYTGDDGGGLPGGHRRSRQSHSEGWQQS